VVPKKQAESMVSALTSKGLPFGYFLFEDEGHGFRKEDNIRRAIEAELYFFSSLVFGSQIDVKAITFKLVFRSGTKSTAFTEAPHTPFL
jgi:hypothetical protein